MAYIAGLARTSLRNLPSLSARAIASISCATCKVNPPLASAMWTSSKQLTTTMVSSSSIQSFRAPPPPGSRWLHSACRRDESKVLLLNSVGFKGDAAPSNLGLVASISGARLNERFGFPSGHQQVRWSGSLKAKGKPRGPLWRQRKGVSKEALQVVFELKRCNADRQKERVVLQTSAARLLKMDLLMVVVELRRQDECALAKQVFDMVRKEEWYKPDIYLYREMMDTLAKNKLIEDVEQLFKEMQEEGIAPDAMILTELMGAYIRNGNIPRAYQVYEEIKHGDYKPDYIMYEIMCRGLKKAGDFEKLKTVMDDCADAFPDNPPPFSRMAFGPGR